MPLTHGYAGDAQYGICVFGVSVGNVLMQIRHPVIVRIAPGIVRRDVASILPRGSTARYVRFEATSFGKIPDWHPGHGDSAFIFVDELLLD